jgi:predicted CXXCH cytochrome family protein
MTRAPAAWGLIAVLFAAGTAEPQEPPAYIGSERCVACHQEAAGLWAPSDHALAWTLPNETTVLGDFGDVTFESDGVVHRFTRADGAYMIETEDGQGNRRSFEVVGVAGIRPLQQYLLSPEPGRTQAFDIVWDTERHVWYDLYPGEAIRPGDAMHWTGPYKSWEARCAECHATGYSRNYDDAAGRYHPEMAEIGVGCEACHGPGEAHATWAGTPGSYDRARWPGLTEQGLTVDLAASAETQIEICAGCHSRRETFFDGNPVPGTPYHDSYNLALLRDGLYAADGQIDAEDYELGSFLQAKMHAQGVRCSDCHEPHALALRADGNAVCTQCHSPAGNPRFPPLRLALYDDPAHHFHPPGSEGAECRSCHMPRRVYMGVDARRDHGFRVPRPDLSVLTGDPNPCTDCHRDKDAAWAAAELERRFPDSAHRGPHFATVFAAARWDPAQRASELAGIAADPATAGIVRATALDLITPVATPALADRAAPLLADPDPLVRAAASGVQRALPPETRAARLLPALRDPLRAVRIAAAKAMLGADPGPAAEALAAATGEWQAAMLARTDFPETHMQLGGAALASRDLAAAEAAFREAVTLDPQLVDGWAMVARIRAVAGDGAGARAALAEALAANPGQPALEALRREFGP